MVLAQREKDRTMKQNRKPRDKPNIYGHLIFDKGGRIYSGGKTVSPKSGAWKTGQLCVKE